MAPLLAAAIPVLADLIPDAIGYFAGDKAEKAADDLLGIASKVTGKNKDEALEAIKADPQTALKFKIAVMEDKYRLDQMFLDDKKDARSLQKEALKQDDTFSKRFVYYFAIGWSLFAAIYMTGITFLEVSNQQQGYANTILGFLLGTAVSAIFQFFYGSSKGSKDKTDIQSGIFKILNKEK